MRKTLLAIPIIGLLSAPTAQAQRAILGLRAGLNWATYGRAGTHENSSLPAGSAGLTFTAPFTHNPKLALQTELLYSGEGSTLAHISFGGVRDLSGTQRLHSLKLPVLLQFRPRQFELEAGPQVGLLLAQQTKLSDGRNNRISSTGTGGFRTFQAGYVVGVGYRLSNGLGLTLRYSRDLTDVTPGSKQYSSVGQFQVSYRFGTVGS